LACIRYFGNESSQGGGIIMSIQSARDFLAKVGKDEEFRRRLGGCKTRADQYQLAQGAGFEFTRDEMKAAAGELQDADLDVISGGIGCGNVCTLEGLAVGG
jgi:predicted ribosomally synthesized peptide with nif11-like leader